MEILQSHPDLEKLGFRNLNSVYWQLHTPQLYEQAVRRQEWFVAHLGPLVVRTGDHTGRSPKDRFIVHEPTTRDDIWWGDINRPFSLEQFDELYQKVLAYFQGKNAFVQNAYAGADPKYRLGVRIITESAWHNLFARNMFIRATDEELADFHPNFTVIQAPSFHAMQQYDGTNSAAFVLINFVEKLVLIGGTAYAGEIKKSIFSVMNYYLPKEGVLPMHCSANEGDDGDVALFFGLSGTGKTTLSSDSTRTLIGDDEHGWSDDGVFNFEGGCYAKVIRLSPSGEPEIYQTTRRFGTILENVRMDMNSRRLDLEDEAFTENTRASYPISHIPNATRSGVGGHPSNILFLTADAFGVMPPVSKLTREQAMYHFMSGYTAKGVNTSVSVNLPFGFVPQVAYSRNTRENAQGQEVFGLPKHSTYVKLLWAEPRLGLRANLRGQIISEARFADGTSQPRYQLWNANVTKRFGRRGGYSLGVFAQLDNLFDKTDIFRVNAQGQPIPGDFQVWAAPRAFSAGVNVEFGR